jgi:hypothetical protein
MRSVASFGLDMWLPDTLTPLSLASGTDVYVGHNGALHDNHHTFVMVVEGLRVCCGQTDEQYDGVVSQWLQIRGRRRRLSPVLSNETFSPCCMAMPRHWYSASHLVVRQRVHVSCILHGGHPCGTQKAGAALDRRPRLRWLPSCAASASPLARSFNDGCFHSPTGKPNLSLTYLIAGHVRTMKYAKLADGQRDAFAQSRGDSETWDSATGENVHVKVRSSMENTLVTSK